MPKNRKGQFQEGHTIVYGLKIAHRCADTTVIDSVACRRLAAKVKHRKVKARILVATLSGDEYCKIVGAWRYGESSGGSDIESNSFYCIKEI